jgi:hypothetical protein
LVQVTNFQCLFLFYPSAKFFLFISLQWFALEYETWEDEEALEGHEIISLFWRQFKGGKSALKVGQKRISSKDWLSAFLA